jgi:WD40 repeat protein
LSSLFSVLHYLNYFIPLPFLSFSSSLKEGHRAECSALAFHPDGSLALSSDWAGVLFLWDLRSGKAIHVFQGHVRKVSAAALAPDGIHAATVGVDNTCRIWDLRQRALMKVCPGHSRALSDIRFSPDAGDVFTTASLDGSVKLWRSRDHACLSTVQADFGMVMSADFTEDSKSVVSVGYDKTIRLFSNKEDL